MSDNATAVKLIVVLAVVILLANLMGVGAASPFQALQDSFSAGPSLPEFDDPFALRDYVALTVRPIGPSNASHMFPDGATGCSLGDYWECIDERNNDTTFVTISSSRIFAVGFRTIEVPDLPGDIILSRVGIEMRYNSTSITQNVTIGMIIGITEIPDGWTGYPLFSMTLPSTDSFTTIQEVGHAYQHISFELLSNNTLDPAQFYFNSFDWEDIDVSFLEITLYAAGDPDCTAPPGAWFPVVDELACQVAQGVDWLITALQFAVNAIIFAFLYVGGWLVWIGTIIAAFLGGVVAMSLWFLDLEAPAVIQGFFGIMTVVVIGFFSLTIIQLVRG